MLTKEAAKSTKMSGWIIRVFCMPKALQIAIPGAEENPKQKKMHWRGFARADEQRIDKRPKRKYI
jgi:hypothetical protein